MLFQKRASFPSVLKVNQSEVCQSDSPVTYDTSAMNIYAGSDTLIVNQLREHKK